jgi:hypothetical protein
VIGRTREELWCLERGTHAIVCELRTRAHPDAVVEVLIVVDGEVSVSHQYVNEPRARFAAGVLKQDHLNAGWKRADSRRLFIGV